nr:sialic acid-binding Ig-like lectin 10 isoform X2 [Labrus bergylta]
MFVLMWSTLLFSVWGSNADVGTSLERREFCQDNFCITLIDGQITAEAGLCVVIPCSFTISYWFSPKGLVWFKCETVQRCGDSDVILSRNNQKIQPGFKGRVSLLEPNLSQRNCSIIINDLTASDSGSYQLKVNLFTSSGRQDKFQYLQRATVLVKDLTQKPTLMIPPLTEGLQSTLTCTAPGLCSGSAPEITWMWRGGGGENDSHITGNITDFKTETLTDVEQRHSSTLSFTPSAKHHGTSITCKVGFTGGTTAEETVTLNVTYVKEVEITGNTSVREGELLQLTCSVESFPPSLVTWTKMSTKDIKSGSKPDVQNDTLANPENTTEIYLLSGNGQVTFSITKVTAKDSGQYICTANHSNITQVEKVDIEVILYPKILNSSKCEVQSDVLTCVCASEGLPLPTIKWLLLENHTQYSVTTTVTSTTVTSTLNLMLKDQSNTVVECVSSSEVGDVKKSLTMTTSERREDQHCLIPWVVVAAVSLSVNVVLIISLMFLWNKRKAVKPNQEDTTYMSLKKRDQSAEYDVIGQPLN